MNRLIILTLVVFLTACVDPFDPPVQDYEELLVVEAFISDDDEPQVVKLSLSSAIDGEEFPPVTGANVMLEDDQGNSYTFPHEGSGYYYSVPGELDIQPGRTYTLVIILPGGESYVSEPVSLKETPPINDVYFKLESFVSETDGTVQQGAVILTDTESPDGEPLYLRYGWEETYMSVSPFPSFYVYNADSGSIDLREDNITECWLSGESSNIDIETSEGLTDPDIREHRVRYLSFNREQLNYRYSILVKQYALDVEGYEFWKSLRETNENTGTLFDVLPFPLTSNIYNESDPDQPVLGYFDIATVSSKRIYIDKDDLPSGTSIKTLFESCINNAGDTLVSPSLVPDLTNQGYLISYSVVPGGFVMVPQSCIDCRLYGSNVKPDFWE
jgi:hypothetical protein